MVVVAQLVRVLVCGAEGRRFEPGQPPKTQKLRRNSKLFLFDKAFFRKIASIRGKLIPTFINHRTIISVG